MIINLNTGITKKNATKSIDSLIDKANCINGNWDKDQAIYNWNRELREEFNKLFKNKAEIEANLGLKGCFDNDLEINLMRIITPPNYEKRRKERSENNKTVFLYQLSVLSLIAEELKLKPTENIQRNKIDHNVYNFKKLKVKFNDGCLIINNIKIDFNNKPLQKDLLNTLFKDTKKNWSNDEIWEDWGENDLVERTLKFYSASDNINKTITSKIGITDFLIKNTKQVRINPKYL